MTITKDSLSKKLSQILELPPQIAYQAVDSIFLLIKETVMSGNRIEIRGFGVFSKKEVKQREGRNPQNGNPIIIKAKSTIKFKPSKKLT